MTIETVQVNITSSIATVVLNRPSVLNAFNEQLVLELQETFKNLSEDNSVRVIVLTGSGKGFSAGADLNEKEASWNPDCPSKDALLRGYMPIFNKIVETFFFPRNPKIHSVGSFSDFCGPSWLS